MQRSRSLAFLVPTTILLALALALLFTPSSLAAKKAKADDSESVDKKDDSKMQASTFAGLELRGIGPALMSGRIADLAVHPNDQSVWYVAVGSGGVWKTHNAGTTWESIFDDQGSYSIGCITLDPSNPEIVWVGTGENVGGRHVGYGDGVYKSLDGGTSWTNMGLEKSEHIGNIVVDPRDSNVVYVAAQGPLWSKGGERGLYKTVDGGATWELILAKGPYTGVNEVRLDPRDPDLLYASTHQRFRSVAALVDGGPESGIHKSTDGGKTWRELKNGLPKAEMGKIGLAVSPHDPDVVYATIELAHREGGFYRSVDRGETWEKRSDYVSGGTGPHYYQEIFASPHHQGWIYQMDPDLHLTQDDGKHFHEVGEQDKHGDNHAMAFDPNDPNYLLVGSDGGLYETWDLGKTWKFITNLPVTQFYKVAVDYDLPFYNVYGGTQDNNSQGGPSRTLNTNGIRSSDWFITLFADGHQSAVDPTNPDIVYAEWQEGNPVRYDRKTGEIVYIQPQGEPGDPPERFNWDAPILISPHDPARLYYASQRVWRSDDRGDSWRPISGDLTRDQDRLKLPMMDRVQSYDAIWDLWAMSNFNTITSLSESPVEQGLFYAGTDDGLIQVTENGGESWRKIEASALPGCPATAFVNDIKADLHDAGTVYVALDNHKYGDFAPYLYRSTDRGASWTSIASDLPERHLVWRLVQDHVKPELLFVGTEFGIFFSVDAGAKWLRIEGGAPTIPFRDLAIQKRENDLVGASFGRGFWILDDYTPLRSVSEEALGAEAHLFAVRDAWWYVEKRPLGRGQKATQGADFFVAPNPDFGATFTYFLRDDLKGLEKTRREEEKKIAKEGGDTPHPGWDALREEAAQKEARDEPAVLLTVRDADGNLVRRLEGPAKSGFHRVTWDLRWPVMGAWRPPREGGGNPFRRPQGWLAAPGTYTVELAKRENGGMTPLTEPQSFVVKPLHDDPADFAIEGMAPAQVADFFVEVGGFQRRISGAAATLQEAERRVGAMLDILDRNPPDDAALRREAQDLMRRVIDLRYELQGHELKEALGEPLRTSIMGRLDVVMTGNRLSTYGPTPTHRRSFEIAKEQLDALAENLERLAETDVPALADKLEAAGLPWTPGQGVPGGR